MDPSISPKAKPKEEPKAELKCKCGNSDPDLFNFWDTPSATRAIHGINEDGILLVSSHYEIDYYGGEDEWVSCDKCGNTFPCPLPIDFVD